MLRLRAVTKTVGAERARRLFEGITLDVADGEYVAVMGESGVGKSTLLNLVAGLDRPDAGSIELDGIELTALDEDGLTLLRRRSMGFVFQAFHILPHLSLEQNVALPLALNAVGRAEAALRARRMLDAVGLGERAADAPRELSGGELQRVAIARALAIGPRLVLADEPTGNLDPDTAGQVLALLRDEIKRAGAMGLLVTHSTMAAAGADRIVVLGRDGIREADRP